MKYLNSFNKFSKIWEVAIPGDAPPKDQVHIFDFDDTLGVTKNANGVMFHIDGRPIHKTREEALDWVRSIGLTEKDLLSKDGKSSKVEDCIVPIEKRDNCYAVYLSSAGLAKIQKVIPKEQQATSGVSDVPSSGESILVDYSPSASTDISTTIPIKSTISKLSDANRKGSDTVVVTARTSSGGVTDLEGNRVDATNDVDMIDFLASKDAKPTLGVYGVSGGDKGQKIKDFFLKKDSDYVRKNGSPDEIHFYDDLSKNTTQVVNAIGGKEDVELFVYGPGEFAHNEVDPNKPNQSFDNKEEKKESFRFIRKFKL